QVLEHGWDFMLKKAVVEWDGAATVHDDLYIEVAVARWGNTSFDVSFVGRVGDERIFMCTITYVGVRLGTRETMPPPDEVRALLGGLDVMRAARGPRVRRDRDLCNGPAKLCEAMGLTGTDNGIDLVTGDAGVWLEDDGVAPPPRPGQGPRIGITKAADNPWRW